MLPDNITLRNQTMVILQEITIRLHVMKLLRTITLQNQTMVILRGMKTIQILAKTPRQKLRLETTIIHRSILLQEITKIITRNRERAATKVQDKAVLQEVIIQAPETMK